ncbi:ATP-binding protein [Nibribacter ruber]|uniref:ATP-binding protein n=1 Tax=Nibribacter ruber TaxID=2698458 RepID=A0A6P1NZR9_9BACT|nr:ATP-binding protein [Nibribacter ruber]QHL87451.1 ATP-binding protein [Nibribacter ruber]
MSSQNFKRLISAPKHFTNANIFDFINSCEPIFSLKNKQESGFGLNISKIEQASMLGVLLIYKIMDFAFANNCFSQPTLLYNPDSDNVLDKYGFKKLVHALMANSKEEEKEMSNLKISYKDNFIIAPQALLRKKQYNHNSLNWQYYPLIEQYYSENKKAVSMILLSFSEILLNFWEHAVDDTKSIIVANGNSQKIEIACADTGNGIITTLGKSLSTKNLDPEKILLEAVKKGVTSKKLTNHMGYGLWILDEIATKTKGRLQIISQGATYSNSGGRKKVRRCGYWQGSIVYLSLPIANAVSLTDILPEDVKTRGTIQINFA